MMKAGPEYWKSPRGIRRRIDSLAQAFNYRVINNAYKVVGETNGVKWLQWMTKGDDKVCIICRTIVKEKGRKFGEVGGFFRITWFMPEMPVHPNCRCQWKYHFEEPMVQTRL